MSISFQLYLKIQNLFAKKQSFDRQAMEKKVKEFDSFALPSLVLCVKMKLLHLGILKDQNLLLTWNYLHQSNNESINLIISKMFYKSTSNQMYPQKKKKKE